VRRLVLLLLVLAAGCGSESPADLPAPAGPPASPPLRVQPAGESGNQPIVTFKESPSVDRAHDRVRYRGRSGATCREPVAARMLGRGTRIAVLCGRERVLEIYDATTLKRLASAPAGIGPTGLATDGVDLLWVTDAVGESLLVYHLRPFELLRRVHLGGGPYAIAFDKERWGLWITLNAANQLVNYAAGNRPVPRRTYPSIRDARRVLVVNDAVWVMGASDSQLLRLRSK